MSESPLLNLPGEIRNEIYSLLLIMRPTLGTPTSFSQPSIIHPEILSVCHQTNREATCILYGKNRFIAHYSLLSGLPQLRRWFAPVKATHLIAQIRLFHVYVRLDCDPHFTAAVAKQSFDGVEELTVEAFQSEYGRSDYSVLTRFELVRGVKRAKVVGSVIGFWKYRWWLEQAMMSPVGTKLKTFEQFDEGFKEFENADLGWKMTRHKGLLEV